MDDDHLPGVLRFGGLRRGLIFPTDLRRELGRWRGRERVCVRACCFVTSGGRELLLAGEKWQFYRQSEPSDEKILCVSVSVSLCNSENRDFPIENHLYLCFYIIMVVNLEEDTCYQRNETT